MFCKLSQLMSLLGESKCRVLKTLRNPCSRENCIIVNFCLTLHFLKAYLDIDSAMCSVLCNSLQPCGLQPSRLLCPQDFPGKNPGVDCHFLLQGVFPTQGFNSCLLCLLHCRQILYLLSYQGSPGDMFSVKCFNIQQNYYLQNIL